MNVFRLLSPTSSKRTHAPFLPLSTGVASCLLSANDFQIHPHPRTWTIVVGRRRYALVGLVVTAGLH